MAKNYPRRRLKIKKQSKMVKVQTGEIKVINVVRVH
jgi:hypothetical protein